MKILFISPTVDAEKRTNKELMMPQLALYILEGLTPPEHKVKIIEEETNHIDLEQECDLVGISCMTANASFNVLTPYPGTKIYEDLNNEHRLTTTNWKYYDHNTVVFKAKNMTPYELQIGKINARKKFYSISSELKICYKIFSLL